MSDRDEQHSDMKVLGYESKDKPNVGWWLEQIAAGEEDRDRQAFASKWDRWRKHYTNETGGTMPINLFFMMARTLIPRTYFRNPSVSVMAAKPGPEQLGLAAVIERLDNKLLKRMKLKQQMKRLVQESFERGTGILKLGYGSEHVPVPLNEKIGRTYGKEKWAKVDYRTGIQESSPWGLHVPISEYVLPAGTIIRESAPWEAHVVFRPIKEVMSDPRLKNSKDLEPIYADLAGAGEPDLVKMIEIHDRRTRKVFIIAGDSESIVLPPMDDPGQSFNGGPFYTVGFNERMDTFWSLPDSQILEPYQLHINEIAQKLVQHARLTTIKFKANREGALSTAQAQALIDPDDPGAVIFMDDINGLDALKTAGMPPELFAWFDKIIEMVRLTVGFGRNQFGEFMGGSEKPSASEAQIVRQAAEIRVDERRDMLADMMIDVVEDLNKSLFGRWDGEDVEQIVGPMGIPIWVRFTGEMLRSSSYELNIDPDSAVPQTKELREQKAVQTYQILSTNPLVDPMRLTRMLLHEMHGVQYDDLINGVPNIYDNAFIQQLMAGPGARGGQPMDPAQLGGMMQQANAGQLQAQGTLSNAGG